MAWTEQADNIEAIERYIGSQVPPRTPAAVAVRDRFLAFMSSLSDFDRNFEQSAYDRVRNYKLEYNRANAVTPVEKAAVEEQARHGLSSEELAGGADRRTSDGSYVPPPTLGERLGGALGPSVAVLAGVAVGVALLLRRR